MSRRYDDPREWCETDAELAREVLDPEELADHQQAAAERARVQHLARRRRDELMRSQGDVWADDYRGPAA